MPGIAFLSGGQSEAEATEHLSLMNRLGPLPWELSFSYGRALQAERARGLGRQGRATSPPAQKALPAARAQLNGLARDGSYDAAMEQAAA